MHYRHQILMIAFTRGGTRAMWGGSALLLSRLLPVGPAGSRPAPGRWAVAAAGAAQHPRDRITPEHSNLKTPAHMPPF